MSADLLVRADASATIGTGHVMRCLALADAWRASGGEPALVTRELPEALARRWRDGGHEIIRIDRDDDLLKPSIAEDASWVVVDGYHIHVELQSAARERGLGVLVIDDHARIGRYDADLVLDQNLDAPRQAYLASGRIILAGPRYALLRREFANRAGGGDRAKDPPCGLLVTLGGSAPADLYRTVLRGAHRCADVLRDVLVVVGPLQDRGEEISEEARRLGLRVKSAPEDMATLMRGADLAVSAAGSTTWELCAMGVPPILVTVSDNQDPVQHALVRARIAEGLGTHVGLSPETVSVAVRRLAVDPAERSRRAAAAVALVDGLGTERAVTRLRARQVDLRPVAASDAEILWKWANDPVTRAMSFDPRPIPREEHVSWLKRKLGDSKVRFYLAVVAGRPVAQVRFDGETNHSLVINVSVAPEHRGRGLGAVAIRAATDRVFEETSSPRVIAWVREDNLASRRTFLKADYDLSGEDGQRAALRFEARRQSETLVPRPGMPGGEPEE